MAPVTPPKQALTALPAQYAKFLTALAGEVIAYVTAYGGTWHLNAALVMAGAALAVLGVPNAAKPPGPVPNLPPYRVPQPGGVTVVPPAAGPVAGPPAPGASA